MKRRPAQAPGWETLNAYVDGELDAPAAAEVAAAVACDGEAARQVALLAAVKARLQEDATEPSRVAAILRSRTAARVKRGRGFAIGRRLGALAAALLLFALAGGGALLLVPHDGTPVPPSLAAALAAHRSFVAGDDEGLRPASAALSLGVAPTLAGQAVYLPDLAAGRLALAALREVGRPGAGLAAHYLGTRGCRLTLFVVARSGEGDVALDDALRRLADVPQQVYGWRVERLDYLLVADGMDAARLKLIAQKIQKGAKDFRPFDETAQLALAESRRQAQPCRA